MKNFKKVFAIILLVIVVIILAMYRQYNIDKRATNETSTGSWQVTCPTDYTPICGSDNITYSNNCAAEKRWISVAYDGVCKIETKPTNTGTTNSGITSSGTEANQSTDTYYLSLEAKCGEDKCCIGSSHSMQVGGYELASADGECLEGQKVNSADCETSYKWCEPENTDTVNTNTLDSNTETNAIVTPNPTNIAQAGKRSDYYSPSLNYGFSVPLGDYFSGFGSRDGANHTVGIKSGTGVGTWEEADVKVYYYKKDLPELKKAENGLYQDARDNKTYLKIDNGTIVIEGDFLSKTVNTIIATIHTGSGVTE